MGKKNGFGAKEDQNQNLGKTKENCEYMKERSERMMGVGVKAFTKEEIKENTAKRLKTENDRGSRRFKKNKYEKYVKIFNSIGMDLLSPFCEIENIHSVIRLRCCVCGGEFDRKISMLFQSDKNKTIGCLDCTRKQISEINAGLFRKSVEGIGQDVLWALNNLNLRVLSPYS